MAILGDGRVDVPLSAYSSGFFNRAEGFIATDILTDIRTKFYSGIFASYGNEHLKLVISRIFNRGEYKTIHAVERSVSNKYSLDRYGLKDMITEDMLNEVDQPFDARKDVVDSLKSLIMIEKEYSIATLMRATATYATGHSVTLSGNSQFSDFANSDPLKTITDAQNKVFESGVLANAMICPYPVLQKLLLHPKLVSAAGIGYLKKMRAEDLKTLFNLDYLFVPRSFYVTAADAMTPIWGKDIILYNKAPAGMKRQKTFGYHLMKQGLNDRVMTKPAPELPVGQLVFVDCTYQYLIMNKDAGYVIKAAIA